MKATWVILLFLSQSFLFAQDLDDGLLISYTFNGNTTDISGNEYHGTPFGISYVADRFGNPESAAFFDGTNDYMDFPNSDELKPDLPVTFAFWVRYDSDDYMDRALFNTSFEEDINTGVYLTSSSSSGGFAVGFGNGSPFYDSSSIESFVSFSEINTGEWMHVAVVVSSASQMDIYVDCRNDGGFYGGSGGGLEYSPTPGCIGRHDQNVGIPGFYFHGAIDDFRYWERALLPEEIEFVCTEGSLSSVQAADESQQIKAYPNPGSGVFNLDMDENMRGEMKIFNAIGMLVKEGPISRKVDLTALDNGIYFIRLLGIDADYFQTIRVVKQ